MYITSRKHPYRWLKSTETLSPLRVHIKNKTRADPKFKAIEEKTTFEGTDVKGLDASLKLFLV